MIYKGTIRRPHKEGELPTTLPVQRLEIRNLYMATRLGRRYRVVKNDSSLAATVARKSSFPCFHKRLWNDGLI